MYIKTPVGLWLITCLAFLQTSSAQNPPVSNSAEIFLHLKKLNVLASVLYVAAHPDDENNGLLPFLAKEKLYRTGYLSLTRGDGGQNLIGSEQGIELGLIRTQELLAARRIDGAEQFFSRAYEFGFSKSFEEALRIWDHDKILSDVVWVIRNYQPDVIIKRFPPDARAGHGHHAASAILADEAFTAAADPNKFPEQFKYGVKPWQARRILWNTFNFGGNNTTSDDQLKMDVGVYNPLIGESYGEIGGEARSMHKSQGEGRPRRRGPITEYFSTSAGEAPKNDLMDGVSIGWERLEGGAGIKVMVDEAIASFNFQQPALSVPALVKVYKAIMALPASNWKNKKLSETITLLTECSQLFIEAVTPNETTIQGDTLRISFNANNRSSLPMVIKKIALLSQEAMARQKMNGINQDSLRENTFINPLLLTPLLDTTVSISLGNNTNVSLERIFKLKDYSSLSQPYWLQFGIKQGYFDVSDQLLIGDAESAANFTAIFAVNIEGVDFTIERPVKYKYVDAVKGEMYEPNTVIPEVLVSISPSLVLNNVVPPVNPMLKVYYTSNITADKVPLSLSLQNGGRTDVVTNVLTDLKKGVSGSIAVNVKSVFFKGQRNYIDPVVTLKLNGKEKIFSQNLKTIKYDHIPFINYFYTDKLKVINDEVKVVGKKIGYIDGAGDKMPDALTAMGYDVKYINDDKLSVEYLKQFDAIVIGIRAYNIYDYLSSNINILNQYVYNGGNLIVQYMKSNQVGNQRIQVGPYPFSVSNSRVTEEDAKVNFLLPAHPVFNYPNKITEADFVGWVQERSTYQADQADARYEKPLGMKDASDKEITNGSLLIGKYGKGNFVYVSLVLFRQLPAGVPGAYRIMANLLALPKNK